MLSIIFKAYNDNLLSWTGQYCKVKSVIRYILIEFCLKIVQSFPEYYLMHFRVSILGGGGWSAQGEKSNQRKVVKTRPRHLLLHNSATLWLSALCTLYISYKHIQYECIWYIWYVWNILYIWYIWYIWYDMICIWYI